MTWVFDGHLDLAMNALDYERDQTLPVSLLREREAGGVKDGRGLCSCSLDSLRRGQVRVCVATVLARAKPWIDAGRAIKRGGDWPSRDMAHAIVAGQLAYYELLDRRGSITLLRDRGALESHLERWSCTVDKADHAKHHDPLPPVGVILTMEGADAITAPGELDWWHARGVRTLMLSHFGKSHYAHGTPSTDPANTHDVDGPLTEDGRALLDRMMSLGMPLDMSHLSDRSFAEAADHFGGVLYASHSSCRSLVAANEHVHPMRMLSDEQVRVIVARGGVVGVPMFNAFLMAGYEESTEPDTVTLAHVADHIDHLCQLAGSASHVAIGSDMDGGFGAEHTPREVDTAADLRLLAGVLSARGYSDDAIDSILHGNWCRFYADQLPAGVG